MDRLSVCTNLSICFHCHSARVMQSQLNCDQLSDLTCSFIHPNAHDENQNILHLLTSMNADRLSRNAMHCARLVSFTLTRHVTIPWISAKNLFSWRTAEHSRCVINMMKRSSNWDVKPALDHSGSMWSSGRLMKLTVRLLTIGFKGGYFETV